MNRWCTEQGIAIEFESIRTYSGAEGANLQLHGKGISTDDLIEALGFVEMQRSRRVLTKLAIGCAGYLGRPLGWARRGWAIVAGLCLMAPPVPSVPEAALDLPASSSAPC